MCQDLIETEPQHFTSVTLSIHLVLGEAVDVAGPESRTRRR